jgi:hypothetical protein
MSVGVTKDYKLKLRNLHASQTLGWSWNSSVVYEVYYESITRFIMKRESES